MSWQKKSTARRRQMDDTLENALLAARALDQLGVRWFLGGSLASSLLGTPRATLDADIVADLRSSHVKPFLKALGDGWYSDEGAIRDAIADRSSFNLIHMENALKVDVFIPKLRSFDAAQFGRIKLVPVEEDSAVEAPVCAAEDIVIAKLEWYKLGGEISERQWGIFSASCVATRACSTWNSWPILRENSPSNRSWKRQLGKPSNRQAETQDRHLRRARCRSRFGKFSPPHRLELRQL